MKGSADILGKRFGYLSDAFWIRFVYLFDTLCANFEHVLDKRWIRFGQFVDTVFNHVLHNCWALFDIRLIYFGQLHILFGHCLDAV